MDSSNDALFDSFLDHPAFRNLSNTNLTVANFEGPLTGVCPEGYKKDNKRLREG